MSYMYRISETFWVQTPPSIYFENQFYTYAFDPTFNRNMWKIQKKHPPPAEEITSEKFESVKKYF